MTPGVSMLDRADGGLTDPQGFGHLLLGHVGLRPDPQHVGVGELGNGCPFTSEVPVPFHHVPMVVRVIARSEVIGMNADWPITGVQDVDAVSGAVENLVGDTVGLELAVLPGANLGVEAPVAIDIGGPSPVPAAFSGGITGHEPPEGFFGTKPPRPVRTAFWPTPKGVTVLSPSDVVGVAQGAGMGGMGTSWDRTHDDILKPIPIRENRG